MLEPVAGRLHEVTVRPTVGPSERNRWDALMGAHHYLPFRGLVGRSVRHVAVLGEHWLALIGWHAGAFKLKARDRWIGWLPEQQFRRLHLIANNARFLILPGCGVANLASWVLGLSVCRVSDDFRAVHGHPILLAGTFVGRSRFTGACYRAANWQALGQTRGFARKPGTPATWVPHGHPKEVLVYPLVTVPADFPQPHGKIRCPAQDVGESSAKHRLGSLSVVNRAPSHGRMPIIPVRSNAVVESLIQEPKRIRGLVYLVQLDQMTPN